MTRSTKFIAAAAGALALSLCASASQAAIFVGVSIDGGATIFGQPDFNPGVNFFTTGALGVFSFDITAGPGVAPTLLDSTNLDTVASGAGTLDVFVTRTDIAGPMGAYKSSFTVNSLPGGWSVLERTFVNADNALFGLGGTLLGSANFVSGPATSVQFAGPVAGNGLYSVTSRYTLHATGAGSNLETITLSSAAVPEPATWALMIMGFGGAGAMLRSRRRPATAAI